MRVETTYTERPVAREIKRIGKQAYCYIRENIHSVEVEIEGETRTEWECVEYLAKLVYTPGLTLTDELCEQIVAHEAEETAKQVRKKRNALLAESDREILPDRRDESSDTYKAWAAYRQALRDLPDAPGFPYVDFPVKPVVV